MYYSAARLIIAQAHIAIELEGPFREAPLTRSLRDVVVVFTCAHSHIEVMPLRCDRSYIIVSYQTAERMMNSPLSHLLGSQLVCEIGDPIADLSSLVLDRQHRAEVDFPRGIPNLRPFSNWGRTQLTTSFVELLEPRPRQYKRVKCPVY